MRIFNLMFSGPARIRKLITGLSIPQEYVCLPSDHGNHFRIFQTTLKDDSVVDVTDSHIFLGYKPLLLGLHAMHADEVCLTFVQGEKVAINYSWRGFPTSRHAVARLLLKRNDANADLPEGYSLYRGVAGVHRFIAEMHQWIARNRGRFRQQREGNVGLPDNLYDQVRIAYGIPRMISLITVGNEESMNMFPTDLHGPCGKDHYISSLRIGGRATAQVEREKQLVLSQMPVEKYRYVYHAGKNHMREMEKSSAFEVSGVSENIRVPLPRDVSGYFELELLRSFDTGIHRIHVYRRVSTKGVRTDGMLAHMHQYPVQWRLDHGLRTDLFLR